MFLSRELLAPSATRVVVLPPPFTNFRKNPADVRIHRTLTGKVLDLGGGTVTNVEVDRTGPNTTSHVEWKLTVPPGKTMEVNYSYESYSSMGK